MHRTYEVAAPVRIYWYADRVETDSPGGLYGRVNETNFGHRGATDYRNPAPEFAFGPSHVLCTVRAAP